ncbi:MAG: hypothetical protein HN353_14130 [Bdellovibrionales bacterium]|jgi:hypothetical protein|nr:hypothetical protein [Bdellovibrionales bacterium]MBT3527021.1 hypothetical protein [Bdellovibrionales bacterium]MBT7668017.1 hypothetical protein [Bdellovibrionales bacterium]MBT7766496.1 hypothetical protein [Bdellovibrionales bacterium]
MKIEKRYFTLLLLISILLLSSCSGPSKPQKSTVAFHSMNLISGLAGGVVIAGNSVSAEEFFIFSPTGGNTAYWELTNAPDWKFIAIGWDSALKMMGSPLCSSKIPKELSGGSESVDIYLKGGSCSDSFFGPTDHFNGSSFKELVVHSCVKSSDRSAGSNQCDSGNYSDMYKSFRVIIPLTKKVISFTEMDSWDGDKQGENFFPEPISRDFSSNCFTIDSSSGGSTDNQVSTHLTVPIENNTSDKSLSLHPLLLAYEESGCPEPGGEVKFRVYDISQRHADQTDGGVDLVIDSSGAHLMIYQEDQNGPTDNPCTDFTSASEINGVIIKCFKDYNLLYDTSTDSTFFSNNTTHMLIGSSGKYTKMEVGTIVTNSADVNFTIYGLTYPYDVVITSSVTVTSGGKYDLDGDSNDDLEIISLPAGSAEVKLLHTNNRINRVLPLEEVSLHWYIETGVWHAGWHPVQNDDISGKQIQYYNQAGCGTTNTLVTLGSNAGSHMPVVGTDVVSGGTHSYKIITHFHGGSSVVSACSSSHTWP